MKIRRFFTGAEWGLLAMTALFLCLMACIFYGAQTSESSGCVITTESGAGDTLPSDANPYEDPDGGFPVNINTANPEELQRLTGVGPVLAERIVSYREEHGPFAAPEDLLSVSGIGEATLEGFRGEITLGEEAAS